MRLKRAAQRDKVRLWYDILMAIIEEEKNGPSAKVTKVQNSVGLASDRFRVHVTALVERGLIRWDQSLNSTEEGRYFVTEYEKAQLRLKRFSLE